MTKTYYQRFGMFQYPTRYQAKQLAEPLPGCAIVWDQDHAPRLGERHTVGGMNRTIESEQLRQNH